MIQRVLYNILTEGMSLINAQPEILEDLFQENYSLTRSEVDEIKQFFREQTPGVIHGWARSDSTFPLYSIVLINEQETESVLADDAGQIEDEDDPDFAAECYTAIWEHRYDVMCFCEHSDAVQYMYEVAKSLMFAAEDYFLQEGLFERHLSGSDVAPDPRYVPEHLFLRRLTFSAQREFMRTDKRSKLYKAFQVRGIHVDRSGSPSDVGDVDTLITTYEGGR
ncbi:MAG: hypothetical protein JSU89_15650 [Myxococcales bacterium]|nr:MAG: hypothetical protein JSU89_15650 [Myxococcales bacterium]